MASIPKEVAVNCTIAGFENLRRGQPVDPRRWVQPAGYDLRLSELSGMRRGDPRVRRQWERHQAQRAAILAEDATREPPSAEREREEN